jgi:hypothetical protein
MNQTLQARRGGEIVAISAKLRELAQDATVGMTDPEVVRQTGLSIATWRKLHDGHTVSDETLLRFCGKMGVDCRPFIQARDEVLNVRTSDDSILMAALNVLALSQESKRELMSKYRECKHSETGSSARDAA